MKIDDIGYYHRHESTFVIDRPNGCENWLLLLIKTPAIYIIDGEMIHVNPNSFILYEPYFPQFYKADNQMYADDWCHFYPDQDELKLMEELNFPRNQVINIKDITDISVLLRNMCYEFYSLNQHRAKTIDLYFRILIYKLNEYTSIDQHNPKLTKSIYFEKLMWIRECFYRNCGMEWSIDKLASDLSLSRSRFQHLYKQTFGKSIMQDIVDARMELAKNLLQMTDLPINDIAQRCGYKNSTYFMRQFKKITGMTPSFYRSSNLPVDIKK